MQKNLSITEQPGETNDSFLQKEMKKTHIYMREVCIRSLPLIPALLTNVGGQHAPIQS